MKFLKKFINFIYLILFYDRGTLNTLCQYYNLSKGDAFWLLINSKRANNILWNMQKPETENQKNTFYENTPFYVFELLAWHMLPYQKKFRQYIKSISKGRVLDYGGGPGDLCLEIYNKGLTVDYADVAGQTFNFAKQIFKNNKAEIKMIDLLSGSITENYDTIICLDVIEHLPKPELLIKEAVRVLKPGGHIFLTSCLVSGVHQPPHHYYSGFSRYWYEKYLREFGFKDIEIKKKGGFFLFYSQETVRALSYFWKSDKLSHKILKPFTAALLFFIPKFLYNLDSLNLEKSDVNHEFTSGYLVKAQKI